MFRQVDNVGVAVTDVAGVAGFFAETVGLPTELDKADPPSAQVRIGPQYLYLFQVPPGETTPRQSSLTGNPPGIDHISIAVDDVDECYAELCARGLAFDGAPESVQEWGIRLAGFQDPEGNRYYLVQPLGQQ